MEIYFIVFWIICGVIAGVMSQNKEQSFLNGFLIGVLLGPIGIIFVQFNKPKDKVACPFCGVEIHPESPICRNCRLLLPEDFAKISRRKSQISPVVLEIILVLMVLCLVVAIIGVLYINNYF